MDKTNAAAVQTMIAELSQAVRERLFPRALILADRILALEPDNALVLDVKADVVEAMKDDADGGSDDGSSEYYSSEDDDEESEPAESYNK